MDSLVSLLKTVLKWGVRLAVIAFLGIGGFVGYDFWNDQLVVKGTLKCQLITNTIKDYDAPSHTHFLLVGSRSSNSASYWYSPVTEEYQLDAIGKGGWEVKTLEIDGVVYLRDGKVVVNSDGQYAYKRHFPGESEAKSYTRFVDRSTLAYLAFGLKKDETRDPEQRLTRQCVITTTQQIASDLADEIKALPDYKI